MKTVADSFSVYVSIKAATLLIQHNCKRAFKQDQALRPDVAGLCSGWGVS